MTLKARRARTIASALTLFVAMTPLAIAHAQTDDTSATPPAPKKPKKPKKPKAAPAAAPTVDPGPTPPPPPPPADPPPPPPPPPPGPTLADGAPNGDVTYGDGSSPNSVYEKPNRTYYFIGLRYRATVLPKFMLNLFANQGQTIVTNTIGVELDIRRDGFSMIPWLVYTDYGTGDMLFQQKGQPDAPQYYSDINSSLKSIYAGVDLLWSHEFSDKVAFEYGAGFGLGFIFGSLGDNWVYDSGNTGPLVGSNGQHYTPCGVNDTELGCNKGDHQNASVAKVGGYVEKNWFGGGSVPVFFPHISIPELGVRYKPIPELETRLSVGFSLTGFFFGISGSYGLGSARHASGRPEASTAN